VRQAKHNAVSFRRHATGAFLDRWVPTAVAKAILWSAFMTAVLVSSIAHAYEFYAFGDSLTDNGRVVRLSGITPNAASTIFTNGRSSNGPVWAEYLPRLIGANFALENDYAINGALSGHGGYLNITRPEWRDMPGVADQVAEFLSNGRRLQPNDLVAIWTGTNDQDLPKRSLNGIEAYLGVPRPLTTSNVTSYTLLNLNSELRSLIAAGGRQFLVLNLNDDNGTRAGYVDYNTRLLPDLRQFSRSGVNVHLFDLAGLLNQMRRNPSAYGLNPDTEVTCRSVPSCQLGSREVQNTYLTADGTHVMTRAHNYIARYIANQLLGPSQIAMTSSAMLDIAEASAAMVRDRLAASRFRSETEEPVGSVSPFFSGTYTRRMLGHVTNQVGYDGDFAQYVGGVEYRPQNSVRVGIAATYATGLTSADNGLASDSIYSYRLLAYGTYEQAGLFADGYVGGGYSKAKQNRQSVVGAAIAGNVDGRDVGAATRVGLLWPVGSSISLGPTIGASYFHVWTSAYAESGDPILTQRVDRLKVAEFSEEAGVEFRIRSRRIGGFSLQSFARVTARRAFLGDNFRLTTAQTYAPDLPIASRVSRPSGSYGHVSIGTSLRLEGRLTLELAADSDFLRTGGGALTAGGQLRYSF